MRAASGRSLIAGGLVLLLAAFGVVPASARPRPVISPQVVHTGTAPTGYEVTFRIQDPSATRMRIKGEWYFSSEKDSSAIPPTSAGRLPSQWQPGDFPLPSPNSTDPNFPVADMVKDPATGVWSYTTPLPSGVFTYQFYRDCDAPAPALTGCTPMSDPANPPWNTTGSIEPTSQVYVPSDKRFGTEDLSWQAPAPPGKQGSLAEVGYPSPQSTTPPGSHNMVVYTPPGYDPNRPTPYPLLVLSHGGGEQEIAWTARGAMRNIVDDLIAAKQIQPLVIVNTNANGIPGDTAGYAADLFGNVIPFMEAHYNVATDASGQGYAGQSAGGNRGNELLFNHTTELGYLGIWSCCNNGSIRPPGDPVYDNPELKNLLGLEVAIGKQDPVRVFAQDEIAGLAQAGVPFRTYLHDGGHTWYFWRFALRDFLTQVAFRTTTTTVDATRTRTGVVLKAKVVPATQEPAVPSGRVQFFVDGAPYGAPQPLHNGVAQLRITASATSYAAGYGGDVYYAPSGS